MKLNTRQHKIQTVCKASDVISKFRTLNFKVCLGVLISLVYLIGMLIFLAIVKNASIVRHSLTVSATAAFV